MSQAATGAGDAVGSRPGWRSALLGGLLLGLASPPAAVPLFGEWLVVPALMLWFRAANASRRPLLWGYVFGAVHMAWFSWSVRHVLWPAYAAIVLVGGLYYLLASASVRALRPGLRVPAFAIAVAGSFWLRAEMPEIYYPHGQPIHCLWQWPTLMLSVGALGEAFGNLLLGGLAAALVAIGQSWQLLQPSWRRAQAQLLAVVGLWALTCFAGAVRLSGSTPKLGDAAAAGETGGAGDRGGKGAPPGNAPPGNAPQGNAPQGSARVARLAVVEPGFHPADVYALPAGQWRAEFARLTRERLVAPTRRLLTDAAPGQRPDLVCWPESALPHALSRADLIAGRGRIGLGPLTSSPPPAASPTAASTCVLLAGANVVPVAAANAADRSAASATPAALWLELPSGRVLGHHEKQRLVPGGEFLPFFGVLPAGLQDSLRAAFASALGAMPNCLPGTAEAPFALPLAGPVGRAGPASPAAAAKAQLGAMLCYDSAFPEPARALVEAGAEILVVLSNETWYRGGAELTQLLAMGAIRALETGRPVLRATFDGRSALLDARGRLVAELPLQPAPQPAARILQVSVRLPAVPPAPLPWPARLVGPISALLAGLACLHGLLQRVRIRSANTALRTGGASGRSGSGSGGS
ncbi:MAG: nitrilase-related carbon-nitrogen hydrolase [Planctomycetota bacterium]